MYPGTFFPPIPHQAQDTVLITDLRGVITSCNLGLRQYGMRRKNLSERNWLTCFCADDQSVLANVMMPAVREKGRCEHELRGPAKSGGEFCLHLCLTLVRDADSIPTALVGVSPGVTENKALRASHTLRHAAAAPVPLARREIGGTQFVIASPIMHKFMGMVDRVAGHTETVLVVGETGTGKELVARTIHETSYRHKNALIDINCAALPDIWSRANSSATRKVRSAVPIRRRRDCLNWLTKAQFFSMKLANCSPRYK